MLLVGTRDIGWAIFPPHQPQRNDFLQRPVKEIPPDSIRVSLRGREVALVLLQADRLVYELFCLYIYSVYMFTW